MADLEWHGADGEWTSGPYRIGRVGKQARACWRLDVVENDPALAGSASPRLVGEYDSLMQAKAMFRRIEAERVHRSTVMSYVGIALSLGLAAAIMAPTVGTLVGFLVINLLVGMAINRLVCAWDIHMAGPSGVPQRSRSARMFELATSLRSRLRGNPSHPDTMPVAPAIRVLPPTS